MMREINLLWIKRHNNGFDKKKGIIVISSSCHPKDIVFCTYLCTILKQYIFDGSVSLNIADVSRGVIG
ncbi:MAG: hypothetical protein ACE5KZ_06200 [Candidatus Scalinduaceae bacterium]